jgi:hypothetical protein
MLHLARVHGSRGSQLCSQGGRSCVGFNWRSGQMHTRTLDDDNNINKLRIHAHRMITAIIVYMFPVQGARCEDTRTD